MEIMSNFTPRAQQVLALARKEADRCRWLLLVVVLAGVAAANAPAEIVFQDFFTQPAGNVTNSVPWIDVEGNGWEAGSPPSELMLDGNGHLYNGAINAAAASGIQLVPIGPYGSMTASAMVQLPVGLPESIDMGFGNTNQFLTGSASGSGPWIQVFGTGLIILYGGAGLNNPATEVNAFTNDGSPVQIFLTYDAFHVTASVGTVHDGVTNLIFNQWPVTNTLHSITAKYLILQFSTNLTAQTARWATAVRVDWIPRPLPMLTLPVPIQQTNFIGSPTGTNDIQLIQSAFNLVANSTKATEIRFTAGATYVITNGMLTGGEAVNLLFATNVLVNGNGCKILITNPRLGFLVVNTCSNIIVQGFTVDYDPLPFTQGVVTHNFYTGGNVPQESAIEFQVDAGYPTPTDANYLDANAVSIARRWGMVMDTNQPGRVAVDAYSQCFYNNVVQTNRNGAFKVYLSSPAQAATIQPGNVWWMMSRWNPSWLFITLKSFQVTYLNNTSYAAAGGSYYGGYTPLINEVNDQIQFGPPPPGATAPRLRTSNSDGGMFVESRIGPWVQGCNFTGLSDDTANTCVFPFQITNAPAQPTNTFAVYINNQASTTPASLIAFQAEVGDTFAFFNATNGAVFDHATVTAVALPNITFDHPITNVVPGNYDTNTLLINESLNTSAVYLDNHFSNSAYFGIYCRANNMLVAHNTISGMGFNAISAFPYIIPSFLNFFVPTNVVILDNVLSDSCYSYDAIHSSIPTGQPVYALIALFKADTTSADVTNGFDISGIRILYNAFLNWRRAPLVLRNVTDVHVVGNYFGPAVTNDGLVPLSSDVISELWASDYPNLRITSNVNATTLPDSSTVNKDGTIGSIASAFQLPSAPQLAASFAGGNVMVSWMSPAPGFVLQQINNLASGSWVDATNSPRLAGTSNMVTMAQSPGVTNVFFRTRQR
jgi:hypothetical protein